MSATPVEPRKTKTSLSKLDQVKKFSKDLEKFVASKIDK